ncbi:MAG: hypothetical protein ACON5B_06880 [Myxococcota bacterium]
MVRIGLMVLGLFGCSPAVAGTLYGADIAEDLTLTASVGYPDAEVGVRVPVTPAIDIQPRLQIGFGRALSTRCCSLGVLADGRFQLAELKNTTLAATTTVGVVVPLTEGSPVGVPLLWPGVQASVHLMDLLTVELGFQAQTTLFVGGDGLLLNLFLAPNAGISLPLTDDVELGLRVDLGPDLYLGERTVALGHLRGVLGMSYRF